jgi:Flp pilus assembly protein TadG
VELNMTGNKNRRGMATLEMLFVLPLLFLILFGIIEFGLVLGRWQTVTNAAREGAREAIVFRQPCNAATVQADVDARVAAYLASSGITADSIVLTGACTGSGNNATVTVQYAHPFQTIQNFAPSIGPDIDLTGTSTMRNE